MDLDPLLDIAYEQLMQVVQWEPQVAPETWPVAEATLPTQGPEKGHEGGATHWEAWRPAYGTWSPC